MASTSIIFLRPPPNEEFVQGFPGIPSHLPERPPATVRGVVELRPRDISGKARWVKIELRRIETLPEGGKSNTYVDFVGESPITLWQAKNEWDEIPLQDLSFQIRVPEPIPPSLELERSAGIKYELVASMLTKGKKGLLRRESTTTITASCPIVIQKHELHAAWPMYARPESRSKTLNGYTLTVNRTHQAYGPGDRIAIQTLVKNDTILTNRVRSYEFSVREHAMYKPAVNQNGTSKMLPQPQTRTRTIVEQRIPITMASPLPPGKQARAELSTQVPLNQTTTTVSFANRIEVQFVIHVRAVLATGLQLFLDLPITMSSWTRAQSIDVVRLIGPAGNLSRPGGAPGPVTTPPGFEHPMARPPQGATQPWMGRPPNGGANPNYFNSLPVTVAAPPNGMGPSPSGDFISGWAAANPPPMTAMRSGPQQPHQAYLRVQSSDDASSTAYSASVEDIGTRISWISPTPFKVNGHFCDVFQAIHLRVGKVALKRPRVGAAGYNEDVIRRLQREAATWERLQHPHILEYLGTFQRDGHFYFVSPFVENGTLVEYIVLYPSVNRVKLLCEVADAISYLHEQEVVHGDIKASNILIGDNGQALLCDFGLTRTTDLRTSTAMKGAGTLRWQSPELWDGGSKSFKSDVYAFGMTIAEVLTGEAPFPDLQTDGAVIRAVLIESRRPPKYPAESSAGLSYEKIWAVAEACWSATPEERVSMSEAWHLILEDLALTALQDI